MKCPKCGSNNIKVVYECSGWNEKGLGEFEQCKDCHTAINEYQARLDKVLSKFGELTGRCFGKRLYHFHYYGINLLYDEEEKKFYLMENIISLETVESILKDLGELE